jgi:predicted  nucleic acid-binding Zn-ribbon protein
VSEEGQDQGLRERLSRQGEEALGKIAEELAGNPMVTGALSRAFEAREKALQAQEAAMGALGIPSAADIERLTRRLRSVSQRLEGIEDSVDRLDERLASIEGGVGALDGQLSKLGSQLDKLGGQLEKLSKAKTPKAPAAPKPSRAAQKAEKAEAERAEALEGRLEEIGRDLEALRRAVAPGEEPPPRAQERLSVADA